MRKRKFVAEIDASATVPVGQRGVFAGLTACLLLALLSCFAAGGFGRRDTGEDRGPGAAGRATGTRGGRSSLPLAQGDGARFLAAINAAEENPDRLDDAAACLDMSEVPRGRSATRVGWRSSWSVSWIRSRRRPG